MYACDAPLERLLDFLFILSNRVIQSEKDSQLLNEKIVDLYLKLTKVFNFKNRLDDIDSYLTGDMIELQGHLENTQLHHYTEGSLINLDFGYNLLEKLEKFRKEFVVNFIEI